MGSGSAHPGGTSSSARARARDDRRAEPAILEPRHAARARDRDVGRESAALAELSQRGFQVVETDREPWSEWSETAGGYVWREDLISEFLSREDGCVSYVAGTVSNQGRFYSQFDAVVLLSAPLEILLRRIETRTSNDYGKSADERALIVGQVAEVERLLRATCTHELDATQPIEDIVDQLVAIGRGQAQPR